MTSEPLLVTVTPIHAKSSSLGPETGSAKRLANLGHFMGRFERLSRDSKKKDFTVCEIDLTDSGKQKHSAYRQSFHFPLCYVSRPCARQLNRRVVRPPRDESSSPCLKSSKLVDGVGPKSQPVTVFRKHFCVHPKGISRHGVDSSMEG